MVFETSAKTNYGMDDMIYEIANEIDSCKDKFETIHSTRTTSVSLDPGVSDPLSRTRRISAKLTLKMA